MKRILLTVASGLALLGIAATARGAAAGSEDVMIPPWAISVSSVFLAGIGLILWANRQFLPRTEFVLQLAAIEKTLTDLTARIATADCSRAACGREQATLATELAVLKQNQRWLITLTQSIAAKVGAAPPPSPADN